MAMVSQLMVLMRNVVDILLACRARAINGLENFLLHTGFST
jgi:hypothetical protein